MQKITATVLKDCNFIKIRLQHRCFPVNIPKVLGTAFLKEQFQWLLLNRILLLISEKNLKNKKVSGEIDFALIILFHVQIQEPASRSTTTRAFVFLAKFTEFYYHKTFQTSQ